jgi:hypothetical protein
VLGEKDVTLRFDTGQHLAYWLSFITLSSHPEIGHYPWTASGKTFSPARIGTFSRFSRGGIGHEKFSL